MNCWHNIVADMCPQGRDMDYRCHSSTLKQSYNTRTFLPVVQVASLLPSPEGKTLTGLALSSPQLGGHKAPHILNSWLVLFGDPGVNAKPQIT